MIRAILFDLDNTLTHRTDSIEAYTQTWIQHYQPYLHQVTFLQVLAIIQRIDHGGYPHSALLRYSSIAASVADALLTELDWKIAPDLNELTQFWLQQFARHAVAMPDAALVLATLKKHQFKLAVVSNGGHASRMAILTGLAFQSYFDVVISSEQAGSMKPQAEIFLAACQQLNVAATECLFVGDHPVNDIQGARQVGMQTLWLSGFHASKDIEIEHKIENLTQVLSFLHLQHVNSFATN